MRAISRIGEIASKLAKIELAFEQVMKDVKDYSIEVGAARDTLAQLYGDVGKVLCNELDAVETGELNSGKDDARAERKSLVNRAQQLSDNIEEARNKLK